MKKLLFLLFAACIMLGCGNNDDPSPNGRLDPNAMVTLRPSKGSQRAVVRELTPLEIVQNAVNIKWQTHYVDNKYYDDVISVGRSFIPGHKDFETPALKMWGIDIITQEGEYRKDLTHAFNVVITDNNNDTIAFVPDAVVSAARLKIEPAFEAADYTEVYRLFDEAFTFIPVPAE